MNRTLRKGGGLSGLQKELRASMIHLAAHGSTSSRQPGMAVAKII